MPVAVVVLLLLVGAVVVTRLSGLVMRRVVRRLAAGRVTAPSGRSESAETGEHRRRQRVDAAARMLNHVVAVGVWIGVTIAVFHLFEIDAAFFLSSAGFIGAGLAIGGQHKVNDYLTGLSVLFEDRYGVGDELVVQVGAAEPIHAVVDHIGLVTTRLRDEHSTLHIPNGQLVVVRNLSQEVALTTVRLRWDDEGQAADAVREQAGTAHLTDVVFVGDLSAQRREDGEIDVAVRTARPLDDRRRRLLQVRAERALGASQRDGALGASQRDGALGASQ